MWRSLDKTRAGEEPRRIVKVSRSRKLTCSFAVLLGLMQPLLNSRALVGLHVFAASHGHVLSLLTDGGHVDLVLSHVTGEGSDDRHAAEQHLHSAAFSDAAHVVHLTTADLARDSARRGGPAGAQAASFTLPSHGGPLPIRMALRSREPSARSSPHLQTVVLRI